MVGRDPCGGWYVAVTASDANRKNWEVEIYFFSMVLSLVIYRGTYMNPMHTRPPKGLDHMQFLMHI